MGKNPVQPDDSNLFLETGKRFSAEEPDSHNTDLVEYQQWNPHHHLIDNIRSWRQNGGNDEIEQNGIFSVFIEKRNRYQTSLGQKDHHNRHLENDAEGYQKSQRQRKILAHSRQRSEKLIVIANQKLEGGRKDNEIPKGGAGNEKDGG